MEKERVCCLDFDGTITTRDTLLAFIAYVHGRRKLLLTLGLYSAKLVAMRLRLYPNWKVKQGIFRHLFRGMTIEAFENHCHGFAVANPHLLRPDAKEAIKQLATDGYRLLVVSASVDNWVRPFFEEFLPEVPVTVLGTEVEVEEGALTGLFLSKNCHGLEKVNRVREVLPLPRAHYYIIAYGDSRGDKELLGYADEGHYKPFR